MMTSDADILRAARDVIWDPANWTKGHYAADSDGDPRMPDERNAISFCSMGAVMKATGINSCHVEPVGRLSGVLADQLASRRVGTFGYGDVYMFNDHPATTHADVMDLFDRAIKYADSGESA